MNEGTNKNHGRFLTVVLVVGILAWAVALKNLPQAIKYTYGNAPDWAKFFLIVSSIAQGPILVGIWFWKKLAVYTLITFAILNIVLGILLLALLGVRLQALIAIAGVILGTSVWLMAIRQRWKQFN